MGAEICLLQLGIVEYVSSFSFCSLLVHLFFCCCCYCCCCFWFDMVAISICFGLCCLSVCSLYFLLFRFIFYFLFLFHFFFHQVILLQQSGFLFLLTIFLEFCFCMCHRRMFPSPQISIKGLESNTKYFVLFDIVPADDNRYKFHHFNWVIAGKAEPLPPSRTYIHPESPLSGSQWMKQKISFNKVKLTNNTCDQLGHVRYHLSSNIFSLINLI